MKTINSTEIYISKQRFTTDRIDRQHTAWVIALATTVTNWKILHLCNGSALSRYASRDNRQFSAPSVWNSLPRTVLISDSLCLF